MASFQGAGLNPGKPLISVIIPTRDRPDTLKICLAALRHERCTEIEIVVQDNASSPETLKVVTEAAQLDDRIVYYRSEQRLSQRHNFEMGLANSRGDYMSIIGDDDAFYRGALQWLASMVRRHRPDAVRWDLTAYIWPSLCVQNVGMFSFHYESYYGGWTKRSRRDCAARIAKAGGNSWDNVLVYHGLISRRLYDTIKRRSNGNFFSYHLPDVYAHNVMPFVEDANLSGDFIEVRHPLTIYGMSGHSSGASWAGSTSKKRGAKSPGKRWEAEIKADPMSHVPWQKPMRTMHYHDYVALTIGRDLGLLDNTRIDDEAWLQSIVDEVGANPWQIKGFMDAKPLYPFDAKLFERVFSTHAELVKAPPDAPPATYTLYEPWWHCQQTCIKAVLPNSDDDVAGAVEVLDSLIDSRIGLLRRNPMTAYVARWQQNKLKKKLKSVYENHKAAQSA